MRLYKNKQCTTVFEQQYTDNKRFDAFHTTNFFPQGKTPVSKADFSLGAHSLWVSLVP